MAPQAPKSKLTPLPSEVPLPLEVGDKVALQEDHPKHPGLYGVIQALGLDPADNALKLDLRIYDPFDGPAESDKTVYRAKMGEIQ